MNSAVRLALEHARARFPDTFGAFELTSVTVEPGPDGEVSRVDLSDRADSEVVARAAAELGWPNHKVSQQKSKIKLWFVERLRDLLSEEA